VIVVVSDASPIRALHFLGLLPILGELYGYVVVPTAVEEELLSPRTQFDSVDLSEYDFIRIHTPSDQRQVKAFLQTLHRGESEALALALELQADLLLIDELAGRKIARDNGVRPLGTLGVLLEAKSKGLVPKVGPLMDRLIGELGFFVAAALRQQILELAGENIGRR
jgi:predicted nucleic acid-binding protein